MKLETHVKGKNILFASFRLDSNALDGVSLETDEWAKVFHKAGASVFYYSGQTKAPDFAAHGFENPRCHFLDEEVREITERMFREHEINKQDLETITSIKDEIKKDLLKKIDDNRIDCLIAENALAFPGNIALSLALAEAANERDLAVIAHDHDFWWERERFNVNPGPKLKELLDTMVAGVRKLAIVVINTRQQTEVSKRFGRKSFVAPNVRDFSKPPEVDGKQVAGFRKELDAGVDDVLVLAPVRIVPRKNLELTIKIVGELKTRAPTESFKVVFTHPAGDEGYEYLKHIKDLAAENNVEILEAGDMVGEGKKYSLDDAYAAADIVAYTTKLEGYGNVIPEAVYYRKPVFVYPYPIYTSDIKTTGLKLIEIKTEKDEKTLDKILEILENPEKRKSMTEHNHKTGVKHLSHTTLKERLSSAFDSF